MLTFQGISKCNYKINKTFNLQTLFTYREINNYNNEINEIVYIHFFSDSVLKLSVYYLIYNTVQARLGLVCHINHIVCIHDKIKYYVSGA